MRHFQFELPPIYDIIANNITLESCGNRVTRPQLFLLGDFMAQTATKTKQAEAKAEAKGEQLDTIPTETPSADIHNMVVTLAATNSPDQLPPGAKTGDQADAYVRTWLEQGFRINSAQVVQAGDVNGIFTLQIFYCLTKE